MAIRVLVVDDNVAVVAASRQSMEASGFIVDTAATAGEAVETAKSTAPDIVILDVQLPDRMGFDIVDHLRRLGAVVVLTSSRSADDYGSKIDESRAAAFVPKEQLSGALVRSIFLRATTGHR